MTEWYIDACCVCRAQDAEGLDEFLDAAQDLGSRFAQAVYVELTTRPSKAPRASQVRAKKAIDARSIPVDPIPLRSPAAGVYVALRGGRMGTSNAGECESIALAAANEDRLFATVETKAGWLALGELEDRARALPSLLHAMVVSAGLPSATAHAIMTAANTNSGLQIPTWWPHET